MINSILLIVLTDKLIRQDYLYSHRNKPNICLQTCRLDSQYGRACSVRCGTGRPLAQRYMSLPARESTFRPGSGRHTGRWTEALTSDCPPRCRYTSGCDRQTCRSCASPSPCTSAGSRGQETEETGSVRDQKENWRRAAGWVPDFHYLCGRIRGRSSITVAPFLFQNFWFPCISTF